MFTSHLQDEKAQLEAQLEELQEQYTAGDLTRQEYLDSKHDLLNGRFEDDVLQEYEEKIQTRRTTRNITAVAALAVFVAFTFLAIPGDLSGSITGLAPASDNNFATLGVNTTVTDTTTLDYTFINATSVRASGAIRGSGETWIYLQTPEGRRLVYYSDTRGSTPTGNAVNTGATPVENVPNATDSQNSTATSSTTNETMNTTDNETTTNTTVNETTNTTENTTSNSTATTNATNSTTNTTLNETTNSTDVTNSTNSTTNTTVNETTNTTDTSTNQTTNTTDQTYSVATASEALVGETVNVNITPDSDTATVYMHTPSDTYLLDGRNWTVTESGDHRVTALFTTDNGTIRRSDSFTAFSNITADTFTNVCVETCSIDPTEVSLQIITNGTRLHLHNISYTAANTTRTVENTTTNSTKMTNTTNTTQPTDRNGTTPAETKVPNKTAACDNDNPNKQAPFCLHKNTTKYFTTEQIVLHDDDRTTVGRLTPIGNLLIAGRVVENSTADAENSDFSIGYDTELGRSVQTIWIDSDTGDMHLRGTLHEANMNLNPPSGSYSISNSRGVYLAYADEEQGDLYIRGNVIPGGLQ